MRLYLSSYQLGNQPERLLSLLGEGRRTAVISNAGDLNPQTEERDARHKQQMEELRNMGLEPIDLDLRNYFGKTEELKKVLLGFNLIWVKGGNAFVLRRAFLQSGADTIIKDLLTSDLLVYGGYSAGIDMLTPSLRGTELVDDPNAVPEGYNPEIIWNCLGILPYAVAPHYKSDHPESAAVDKSVEYLINNHIPFIALRDGEVIVRNDDTEAVFS